MPAERRYPEQRMSLISWKHMLFLQVLRWFCIFFRFGSLFGSCWKRNVFSVLPEQTLHCLMAAGKKRLLKPRGFFICLYWWGKAVRLKCSAVCSFAFAGWRAVHAHQVCEMNTGLWRRPCNWAIVAWKQCDCGRRLDSLIGGRVTRWRTGGSGKDSAWTVQKAVQSQDHAATCAKNSAYSSWSKKNGQIN